MNTSAPAARRCSTSRPPSLRRSTQMDLLPRLNAVNRGDVSPAAQMRNGSPAPGGSTLMTPAPSAIDCHVHPWDEVSMQHMGGGRLEVMARYFGREIEPISLDALADAY